MRTMWTVILIICGFPLISGHLSFFSFYPKNKTNTNKVPLTTPLRLNTSISIRPTISRISTITGLIKEIYTRPTANLSSQPQYLPAVTQSLSTVDPEELTIFEKHEFEGEVPDDEYPDNNECMNTTAIQGSGQEIDETRNCSPVNGTVTTTETGLEIDESNVEIDDRDKTEKRNFHFSLGSFLPPISELPVIKPSILAKLPLQLFGVKKKTVTLTNYLMKTSTVYYNQYATCLLLENVKSLCNGNLITIKPTNTILNHATKYKRDFSATERMNYELKKSSVIKEEESLYHPTSNEKYQKLASSTKVNSLFDSIIEPSELDYEFEEISLEVTSTDKSSTPGLKTVNAEPNKWTTVQKADIGGLKIERIDSIIPTVTTETQFNYDLTATVIAQNCLPLHLNIPFCSPSFLYQADDYVGLLHDAGIIYY